MFILVHLKKVLYNGIFCVKRINFVPPQHHRQACSRDFEQKRRKVKRVPENVTQVSFKSRSVVIPSQYQGAGGAGADL